MNNIKIKYHLITWTVLIGGIFLWQPFVGLMVGILMLTIFKLSLLSHKALKIILKQMNE